MPIGTNSPSATVPSVGHSDGTETVLFATTCLAVLFLPNAIIAFGGGGATVYLSEIVAWLAFLPLTLLLILMGRLDPISVGLRTMPEIFLYLAVISAAALLTLGYNGSGETIGKVKNIMPGILLALLVVHSADSARKLYLICLCVVVGGFVNASLGIVQFAFGTLYFVEPLPNNEYKLGFTGDPVGNTANGLFPAPNALGVALVPAFVLGTCLLVTGRQVAAPATRWLLLPVMLVIACGIYVSFTRGAVLWSLVGIVAALAPVRRKIAFSLLLAAGVLTILILLGLERSAEGAVTGDTFVDRMLLWRAAWETMLTHPSVIVYGDGVQEVAYQAATLAGWPIESSHNTWIDQLLFFGAAGLLTYALVWSAALMLVSKYPPGAEPRPIRDGVIGALIAMLGLSVLEPLGSEVYAVGLTFVLIGMAQAICRCRLDRRAVACK
jgi:hypothetical protein